MSTPSHTIIVAGSPIRLYPMGKGKSPWVALDELLPAISAYQPERISALAAIWLRRFPDQSQKMRDGRLFVPSGFALVIFQGLQKAGEDFHTYGFLAALYGYLGHAEFCLALQNDLLTSWAPTGAMH